MGSPGEGRANQGRRWFLKLPVSCPHFDDDSVHDSMITVLICDPFLAVEGECVRTMGWERRHVLVGGLRGRGFEGSRGRGQRLVQWRLEGWKGRKV